MPLTRVLKFITGIVGRILLILMLVATILMVPMVRIVTLLVIRAAVGVIPLVVVGRLLVLVAAMVGVTMMLLAMRFLGIGLLVVMVIGR